MPCFEMQFIKHHGGFQYQLFSLLSRRAAFVYKRTTLSEYGTSQIVGHVPLTLSRVFHLFLKHGGQISVEYYSIIVYTVIRIL